MHPFLSRLTLTLALLVALVQPTLAAPASYTLVDLGDSSPQDVGNDGTVVGTGGANQAAAILYPTPMDLSAFGGTARAILGDTIVGEANFLLSSTPTLQTFGTHAFRSSAATGLLDLGTAGSPLLQSRATALSPQGYVVGSAEDPVTRQLRPTIWAWGRLYFYPTLGGATGEVEDINVWGEGVGQSATASGAFHATLWWLAFAYELVPGSPTSIATAINNNGWAVGGAQFWNGYHGFIWHPFYGALNFGTLPGDVTSTFTDINDHEDIVGVSTGPGGPPPPQRAIRIIQGRWEDLNTLVTAPGWVLETATAISNTGFIVGTGRLNGHRRGWLLVPASETVARR